ncbi:hypothetical protein BC332_18201 [Capsicum chinense]|nr:hypothetical protein BC332_18201 [Capsicum chinense]
MPSLCRFSCLSTQMATNIETDHNGTIPNLPGSHITSQLTDQEINSNVDLDSQDNDIYDHEESQERDSYSDSNSLYENVLDLLDDDMYDHEEEGEDDDDVLKYLKIRIHHASAKDVIDPQVVVDDLESSEICVICHSENKHKKSIGTLQCRHGYHTDCIK